MKRFYKLATAEATTGGWSIMLDGRPVRTPGRAPLVLAEQALADAIATEWSAQGEDIDLASMPVSGLANAAIDIVSPDPAAFAAPLAAYGESDLLCYRAPEADLAAHQAQYWNPVLNWAEQRYGVEFALTSGVMHVAQPAATTRALAQALAAYPAFALAALSPIITIGGSLVLALALAERAFAPEDIWQASVLDELWQEARWGADADAVKAREAKHRDWAAAARFLAMVQD